MATYIILSRFSPEAFGDPTEVKLLAAAVAEKIKTECPGVVWKDSFATPARWLGFHGFDLPRDCPCSPGRSRWADLQNIG